MSTVLSLFLSAVLAVCSLASAVSQTSSPGGPVPALQAAEPLSAAQKQSFAQERQEEYAGQRAAGMAVLPTREAVNALLLQVPGAGAQERAVLNARLAACGVYEFTGAEVFRTNTGLGDVYLDPPAIYYEAWSGCWSITCGGVWNSAEYGGANISGAVGGPDAFGVGFTHTNGQYSAKVVCAAACLADEGRAQFEWTDECVKAGEDGFVFQLQDGCPNPKSYVGQNWAGVCTYDQGFGAYSGVATAFYAHTYDAPAGYTLFFGPVGVGAEPVLEESMVTMYSSDATFGNYPFG